MFEVVGPSFGQDLAMSYAISQMLRRADQEPARSPPSIAGMATKDGRFRTYKRQGIISRSWITASHSKPKRPPA